MEKIQRKPIRQIGSQLSTVVTTERFALTFFFFYCRPAVGKLRHSEGEEKSGDVLRGPVCTAPALRATVSGVVAGVHRFFRLDSNFQKK